MTKIYLVRHAEAEGNLFRRAQGQFDGLVTALGYEQIGALQRRFAEVPLDAVYASDLFRTRMTAKALYVPKGLPLQTDRALREFSIGEWEDVPWAEWEYRDRDSLAAFNALEPRFHPAGGETPAQVRSRILGAFRRIARANEGKTIAVVSHGMATRILLGTLQGLDFPEMRDTAHSDNTAVSLVEAEGDGARVVFRDDNSHLGELSTFAKQSWWKEKGGVEASLRYRTLRLPEDEASYLALMESAFSERHDPLDRFRSETALTAARQLLAAGDGGVRLALFGETPVGLVAPMDETCWFYLTPGYRSRRLGIQLVGEAVAVLRRRGKREIRILCESEEVADYLQHYGFCREGLFCHMPIVAEE